MKEITNKILVLFVVTLCAFTTLQAQVIEESYCPMYNIEEPAETSSKLMSSCNPSTDICTGKYKPGKGTLKMLMVYIRFADDNTSMSYWNSSPNPSDIYDVETWMEESLDENVLVGSDNYFNVTNYFKQMSRGEYNVIGDVVYIELPSKSTFTDDGTPLIGLSLMEATNKYALEYLDNSPQIDLSYYDNFDYVSDYHHDQTSDNILDMVYMVYRTPGLQHFAGPDSLGYEYSSFGGIAQLGKSNAQIALPSGLVVDYGAFANGSGLTMHLGNNRKVRFDDSYIHELAHYLMGNGHPYTNGTSNVNSKGRTAYWGIFGGNEATNSVNAYEQELLGWITPTELTNDTTFTLSDFVTTGASYKYTVSPTEFYYFENRQKVQSTTGIDNTYDQPNWNDIDKGLFILHVKEDQYGRYLYSGDNSLESIVSDGNWDWELDDWSVACGSNPATDLEPVFERSTPNQFGESFKDPLLSVTKPTGGASYKQKLFIKPQNTAICKRYFLGYDSEDKSGFTEIGRSLITPYTNPTFLTRSKSQTGIGLKITGKFGNTLAMKFYDENFNPYSITENTTWDGQIFLEQNTYVQNGATLTILPGTDIYLGNNVSFFIQPGGQLISEGTELDPIHFQRAHPDSAWNRIALYSSEGNSLSWNLVEGGYINLSIASKNNTITHSTFRDATFRTMEGWHNQDGTGNASVTISHSLIENSKSVGIVAHYLDLDLSHSTIQNNNQDGLYIHSSTVFPFYQNLITNNGLVVSSRDGARITSSGTFYMLGASYDEGYNEISDNSNNQIENYGDTIVGAALNGSGGYNSVKGNYSGSNYLVANYGSPINSVGTWWGQTTIDPAMFTGTVTGTHLTSDPTTSPGNDGESPSKAVFKEEVNFNQLFDEAEEALSNASNPKEIHNRLHHLYQIEGLANKPDITDRFQVITTLATQGGNSPFQNQNLTNTYKELSEILHTKSLIRNENYSEAQSYLDQLNSSELSEENKREYLDLRLVTETYHGKYETALSTLEELYSLYQAKGETEEEVKSRYSLIREDIQIRLKNNDRSLIKETVSDEDKKDQIDEFTLQQNYPNPFNPTTNISFTLVERGFVSLKVYDILGRVVANLVYEVKSIGTHSVSFDASFLSSGIYMYKLEAGQNVLSKRMTLIK